VALLHPKPESGKPLTAQEASQLPTLDPKQSDANSPYLSDKQGNVNPKQISEPEIIRNAVSLKDGKRNPAIELNKFLDAVRESQTNQRRPHNFAPEYENRLERIELSIQKTANTEQVETLVGLIRSLPEYTKITIFQSVKCEELFRKNFSKELFNRITFISVGDDHSKFLRDTSFGDSDVRIFPVTHTFRGDVNGARDASFLAGTEPRRIPVIFDGGNYYISKDNAGRKILLIGSDSVVLTREFQKNLFEYAKKNDRGFSSAGDTLSSILAPMSDTKFEQIMKAAFNVDRVEIIGQKNKAGEWLPQPRVAFHLDQLFIPLKDGILASVRVNFDAMPKPTASELQSAKEIYARMEKKFEVKFGAILDKSLTELGEIGLQKDFDSKNLTSAIANEIGIMRSILQPLRNHRAYNRALKFDEAANSYRAQLESKGFGFIDLEITPQQVDAFQSPTNGVVYTHLKNGNRVFKMPIYPDAQGNFDLKSPSTALNIARLQAAGIQVIAVPERDFFRAFGNLHCITR
jgi:hypothetical protein